VWSGFIWLVSFNHNNEVLSAIQAWNFWPDEELYKRFTLCRGISYNPTRRSK